MEYFPLIALQDNLFRRGLRLARGLFSSRVAPVLAVIAVTNGVFGQIPGNVRIYNVADGLRDSPVTAVTVSPRGNIWLKHGELEEISWLDGYSVKRLPSPGGASYRVYESRSAQVWSLYPGGVAEYQGGQWIKYPLPEIRAEFQTNVLRQVRQLPLVPGEREHILFLLPDRLMEYHAGLNQTTLLRAARSTQLEKFVDMTLGRDGGVWITGGRGLAKLPGPVRQLSPQSEWREYIFDESLGLSDLQRPFEDDQGGVTMVADLAASNRKAVVHFDGQSWEAQSFPGETIRQAWRDTEQNFWALTINSLLRLRRTEAGLLEKQVMATGQFFDAATEPKGIFWVGSNQGLIRYAPCTWRSPVESPGVEGPFYAICEAHDDRLWFGGAKLLSLAGSAWREFSLPPEWPGPIEFLAELPNHTLALGSTNSLAIFDPAAGKFLLPPVLAGTRKVIGKTLDGRLVLRSSDPASTNLASDLAVFDGEAVRPLLPDASAFKASFVPELFLPLSDGDFWLAGQGGIGVYRENQLHPSNPRDKHAPIKPVSLLEIAPGKIWCGEEGRITEFDGKSWSVVRLSLGVVHGMTKSRDGSLWVASSGGLFRFQKNSWVLNHQEDGLPNGAIYTVFEDRHGRLWAAGQGGISLYFPEADIDPPRTFISKADNSSVASTAGAFSLLFSGRDKWKFTEANRLLFSYRLDHGLWSPYTNQSSIVFKNLTAGNHQFAVRAMDRNWNEDPEGASFEFVLLLPWYKEGRLVAIMLLGLTIILLLGGLAVNRHLRLVKSYAEVENIVAERTRELEKANQALLHSQKMKALGTLAAGVAHDFNNILSIIRGSAQIIESNLDDRDKVRTRVNRIKTVVDQGTGLVKAMLGFGRLPEKEGETFEVGALLEETARLLADRFPKDLHVRIKIQAQLPPVQGSKELLQQILLNLILNAADAIEPPGEIVLNLTDHSPIQGRPVLSPRSAPGYVYIAVEDSGHGIPEEVLPRIFEPFFTTKAFSSRRGTGLGLSMVYELAKETGYGLSVHSVPQQGTTFIIIVPLTGPAQPAPVREPVPTS